MPRGFQQRLRALSMIALLAIAMPSSATALGDRLARADAARTGDPQRFSALMAQARALQHTANDEERDLLSLLGAYGEWRAGRLDRAIDAARRLSATSRVPDLRYRATLLVANLSAVTRDYATGAAYLARAAAMEDRVSDPETRAIGLGVAATLYNQFEQHELAETYASRMLDTAHSDRSRCLAAENLARARVHLHRPVDEARDLLAPMTTCRRAGEQIAVHLLQTSQARFLMDRGRHADAADLLQRNLASAEASGYTRLTAEFHSLIAEARLQLGDLDAAEVSANIALRSAQVDSHWMPLLDARRVLYEAAKRRGNAGEALRHLEALAAGERAELTDLQARERAYQDGQIQLLRQQQLAEGLRQQNRVLQLEQRVAAQRRTLLFTVVGTLAVVVSLLTYWSWRLLRVQRRLRHLSERDPLTGISNRRHFTARVQARLDACRGRREPVSLLLLDLDHFKSINDRAGHEAGDRVLVAIARLGRAHAGAADMFGRLGGEEYGLCLPGATLEDARAVAIRLQQAIPESVGYRHPDGGHVTASIGVSSSEYSGYEYDGLMRAADTAMYRAKALGRNRVEVAMTGGDRDATYTIAD
ncbi:GGDEF domain-containing protein [Cognatilysobacter segetis]|uniref:GGDEF domain-containing protein n=1 Tax=Cognatilysobacter segetis TaxID=2492394 RepID=UPI00105E992F|nr:GGDEF domain-containing protein [Lysobacter segetis]